MNPPNLHPLPTISLCMACCIITTIAYQALTRSENALRSPNGPASSIESYDRMPLSFEVNSGQTDPSVKFILRGLGYNLFLTSTEAVLMLSKDGITHPNSSIRLRLSGANSKPRLEGIDQQQATVNYFVGKDVNKWKAKIPTYARVKYHQVYPGVDLVYYGNQRQLEYDFIVGPGRDPDVISLNFEGVDKVELDSDGELILQTAAGQIRQRRPAIYQEVNGVKKPVAGTYELRDRHAVGFQVGAYDPGIPLVIDPVLVYAAYPQGSSDDGGRAIATDGFGNAYITGFTLSTNFPTVNPVQPAFAGGSGIRGGDVFITKFDPAGAILYSTYLGGTGNEMGLGIAVDSSGNAYVTGRTRSFDFPTTPGALSNTCTPDIFGNLDPCQDAFVTKLDNSGSVLAYSTYLGSGGPDEGRGIVVDTSGNAYITGIAYPNFPTTPGALKTSTIVGGPFVAKLNPTGSSLVYSTYLFENNGGNGGSGIAIDASGNAYVVGRTFDSIPTTPGAFQTSKGVLSDAFVTKLNPSGSTLLYCTYVGGNDLEDPWGIAVDTSGSAYITGETFSTNFPTSPGAFMSAKPGTGFNADAFVTKLNPTGSALGYSTYLGGSGSEAGRGIAVDASGHAVVTGFTTSTNFPTLNAFQNSLALSVDGFVSKLSTNGAALVYSTYFGGTAQHVPFGLALDNSDIAYVTGETSNSNAFAIKVDGIIIDTTPPTLVCSAGIVIDGNIQGQCSANVSVSTPTATDNNSSVTVTGTRNDNLALTDSYPLGTTTIIWTATDSAGNVSTCSQPVTVINPNPVVTINSPSSGSIYTVGTAVNFTGSFSDNAGGTHTATWTFDTITQPGVVDEDAGGITTTMTFASAGVYLVTLTVNDGCDGMGSASTVDGLTAMVVVYDPNAGFVTGGGWIDSPPGAFTPDAQLTGKASFGFVAKYQNGATVPTGNNEFQFRVANFNFKSSAYEWLVVTGAKAQFKGLGTINGLGNYGFRLTAIDGDIGGGGGVDKYRIRIWDKDNGNAVVYDNKMGSLDGSNDATELGGGSIIIHRQ